MKHQINSVTAGLSVDDLDRAISWYRQLFGEGEEVTPAEGVWEMRITGSFWLQLFLSESGTAGSSAVGFETANIRKSHDVASSLINDIGAITTVPDAICYFEFRDPFGNQLSFYELLAKDACKTDQ